MQTNATLSIPYILKLYAQSICRSIVFECKASMYAVFGQDISYYNAFSHTVRLITCNTPLPFYCQNSVQCGGGDTQPDKVQ